MTYIRNGESQLYHYKRTTETFHHTAKSNPLRAVCYEHKPAQIYNYYFEITLKIPKVSPLSEHGLREREREREVERERDGERETERERQRETEREREREREREGERGRCL